MYVYLLAVIMFGVAIDHARIVNASAGCRPDVGVFPYLFDFASFVSNLGILILLIAGFFIGSWWWPIAGLLLAWLVIFFSRSIPAYIGFVPVIIGGLSGLGCSIYLFIN